MLPLPSTADIQRVDFGINLDYTSTEWHTLPLSMGNQLVDIFRGSVVMPPRQGRNVVDEIAPDYYSLRIVDKKAKEYSLSFRVDSNEVWANDSWYVLLCRCAFFGETL